MKVAMLRVISLWEFFLLIIWSSLVCGQGRSGSRGFYRGRHVCASRQQVTYQAPLTQSYRRPIFRQDLGRTVYQTAYRTVLRIKLGDKLMPGCCPGWTKRSARDVSCMQPVCKEECVNGRCIRPNICLCDKGYSGYKCDKDINECLGRHQCQQKCINTNGTYECACQDGFQLAEDKMSCNLCLACTQEFQAIQQQMLTMNGRIQQLEADKMALQTNLTSALAQYEAAVQAVHEVTPHPPTTTPLDPDMAADPSLVDPPYIPLDRLASLSQQISILEEKMASCMCGHDYSMLG